jgi:staphylococcal nuclease domain-containing protein 1
MASTSTTRGSKPHRDSRSSTIEAGVVKGIISGSTIQIVRATQADKSSSRGPTEYEISLQGIRAPLGGGKDRNEEPWYFQSREFLRAKLIGAQVAFSITHSGDGARRFGLVFTLEGEDIRETIVSNGWAEVKPQPAGEKNEQRLKSHARLVELQTAAKDAQRGMWAAKSKGVRAVQTKFDAVEVFEKLKGKVTPAIVEQVRSGSTLRVYVPSTGHVFPLLLSGVQSPIVKPHVSDEQQQPWARAARFFSELHALHRDVEIVLESLDKANNFYGSVSVLGANLGVKLLEAGLARFVDWSATKTSNVDQLKKAEKSAQAAASRLWAAGVRAPSSSASSSAPTAPAKRVEFWGQVTDIINTGTIQVVEFKDGQKGGVLGDEHRINFSSLQAARLVPREKLKKTTDVSVQEILAAYEGRNFLRRKLIGQKVRVVQDYFREANKEHNIPERAFFTVYHEKKNVGLELVSQGFAAVSEHKESDARSPDYQEFIVAEAKAKKRNLGLFAKPGVTIPAFNDLSDRDAVTKEAKSGAAASSSGDGEAAAKASRESVDAAQAARLNQFLPHVQGTRLPAVVERVFSATRMKVWVDKIQCMLPITLACVRGEKMEAAPGVVPASYPNNKGVGNVAYNTVRGQVYLRDVEILIDSVDRTGAFNATVFVNGKDLSIGLLQEGLVKLLHAPAKRTKQIPYEEFRKYEDSAKAARKGMWLNWDEAEDERRIAAIRAKRAEEMGIATQERKSKTESFHATITEIIDCTLFYFRRSEETESATFERITDTLQTGGAPLTSHNDGDLVAAQFASDQTWYRARIVKAEENDQFLVYYIDYGNSEIVAKNQLRALPAGCALTDLPAQAQEATLAYIKCPTLGEEHGPEAADFLKHLVWEKPLLASIHWTEGSVAHVVLGDPATSTDINGELLRNGFARVPFSRIRSPILGKMREFEEQARTQRLGIWQYGDIIDSDEE